MALQIRRGLEADRVTFAPAQGELLYTTDDKKLYIGDGTTPGGNAVGGGDLVTEITTAQFVHNQHSNMSFTYDVGTGRIIGNIPNFNIKIAATDSTVRTVNLGETIQFSGLGGTTVTSDVEGNINISTLYSIEAVSAAGGASLRLSDGVILDDVTFLGAGSTTVVRTDANTITISSSGGGGGGASNSFETIVVAGQPNVVADNGTDVLTLAAGFGISITTNDISDTITFNNVTTGFDRVAVAGNTLVIADGPQSTLTLVAGNGISITTDSVLDSVTINTSLSINDITDVAVTLTGINPGEALVWDGAGFFVNQELVELTATGDVAFYTGGQKIGGDPTFTFDPITGNLNVPYVFTTHLKAQQHWTDNPIGMNIVSTSFPYTTFGGPIAPGGQFYTGLVRTLDLHDQIGPISSLGSIFLAQNNTTADINPQIGLFRARGTITSQQKVLANDVLGSIGIFGFNGVDDVLVGKIGVKCETTPVQGQSNVPGSLFIQLTNNDNILNTALTINSNARVDLTGDLFVAKQINNNTIRINNNVIETIVSNANLELRTSGNGAIYLDNISINQGIIDTLDSSAIVVTPAAIFSSDVTVQNNLIVTNKVYAEEFVSTSNVTPEISAATQLAIKVGNKEWDVNANGTLQYPILSSAPSSPANGMMAIADGIGWDPLSLPNKQQMVVYLGGGWRQIAVEP